MGVSTTALDLETRIDRLESQFVVDLIWPAWRETHHWTTNLVVEIDGDRARGVCDVNCNGANPEDDALD